MDQLNHLSPREQARLADLIRLVPRNRSTALEIGARDGFIAFALVPWFCQVTALDLEQPTLDHERIINVAGDVRSLEFPNESFDVVVCAEVLEHVPSEGLKAACSEIVRVARHSAVIGVPYKQDLRRSGTTCASCGRGNPPWGHVNSFDERRLCQLFTPMKPVAVSYVGRDKNRTNFVSAALMSAAGNPYGTYEQTEACIFCGARLTAVAPTILQKVLAKGAIWLMRLQEYFTKPQPMWVHILFEKNPAVA